MPLGLTVSGVAMFGLEMFGPAKFGSAMFVYNVCRQLATAAGI
jgi:hypothetical protein